tara:strand:- start:459 stop:989 length:531 start_codon:yes stop_codon:yes gene_type:complete
MKNKKILIVGAGPTGLTIALMLARQGKMPRVIDKVHRFFSSKRDALRAFPLNINISKINLQSTFNVGVRRVDHFQVKNVFLAGDAAHIHTPLGGRGMNLAMQDAFELAQRFKTGHFAGYNNSRQKEARITADFMERMRRLISSTNPFVKGFLTGIFKMIHYVPFLKTWLVHQFMRR